MARFAAHLRSLKASSGNPSIRDLEKLTSDVGSPYKKSTIADKLSGNSKPDWLFVKTFVRACHKNTGAAGEPDLEIWRKSHLAMARKLAMQEKGSPGRILSDLEEVLSGISREDILRVMHAAGISDPTGHVPSPSELIARVTTLEQMVRLIDASIHSHELDRADRDTPTSLAQQGETVSPLVVFHSTGERVLVTLPLDMEIRTAGKYIVGEIFFRELPPSRRSGYLTDTTFTITHDGHTYYSGTLRDAGIRDQSQISVSSHATYPWHHNAELVAEIWELLREGYELRPKSALVGDMRATFYARMQRRGMSSDGMEGWILREHRALEILPLPKS